MENIMCLHVNQSNFPTSVIQETFQGYWMYWFALVHSPSCMNHILDPFSSASNAIISLDFTSLIWNINFCNHCLMLMLLFVDECFPFISLFLLVEEFSIFHTSRDYVLLCSRFLQITAQLFLLHSWWWPDGQSISTFFVNISMHNFPVSS